MNTWDEAINEAKPLLESLRAIAEKYDIPVMYMNSDRTDGHYRGMITVYADKADEGEPFAMTYLNSEETGESTHTSIMRGRKKDADKVGRP